jgi:hypothetical protein
VSSVPRFERYLSIDYSGAKTADASLTGLRVYEAAQVRARQCHPNHGQFLRRVRRHLYRRVWDLRANAAMNKVGQYPSSSLSRASSSRIAAVNR